MNALSHEQAKDFVDHMTDAQLARVMNRLGYYSAAFPDIRDAAAQAVTDELSSIAANRLAQPDDPGIDEFLEPDIGKYPGWLTVICWLTPTAVCWFAIALLVRWLFK